MFRVIGLAETAGYGFDKIYNGWKTYVEEPPKYQYRITFVELKLTTQKTTQKQKEIIEYLRKKPSASRKHITEKIQGITEDGVKNNLGVLQEKGLIKRVGSDKGGYWEVMIH